MKILITENQYKILTEGCEKLTFEFKRLNTCEKSTTEIAKIVKYLYNKYKESYADFPGDSYGVIEAMKSGSPCEKIDQVIDHLFVKIINEHNRKNK